jgi:D-glycero-D-manno-heptose 1,7-bisphosphate phosphatase
LLANAEEGVRLLAKLPLHILVVSNQAGIPLGKFTVEQMSAFNHELRIQLERAGGRIDAFYYSPYPEAKDLPPGSSPSLYSKPSPGMLLEAARDFDLDLKRSFLVGDKTSDIAAGQRVGCTTLLVRTGSAGREEGAMSVKADFCVEDLSGAARLISTLL